MAKTIILKESDLRRIIRNVLSESWDDEYEYSGENERLRDMEAQCMEELFYFEDGTIIPEGEDSDLIDMEYVPVALYPVFSDDYDDVIDVEFKVEWNYRSDGMQKKFIDDEVQAYIDAHSEEIMGRMISRL